MTPNNPLLREALHGIDVPHPVHLGYLHLLLLQAVALFLWWPKSDLSQVLGEETAPSTLLALVVVVGLTLAWQQMRTGAGELLLPGQNHLVEWLLSTPLAGERVVAGHVAAQVVQLCHAMALSAPLLLVAFSVSAAPPGGLALGVLALAMVALEVGLLASLAVLMAGQREGLRYFAVRGLYLLVLAGPALAFPPLGVFQFLARNLAGGRDAVASVVVDIDAPDAVFLLGHAVVLSLLLCALAWQALRLRRSRRHPGEGAK